MGSDLVSACVFCAGLLLGMDLPPTPGIGAEIGLAYATLARRYDIDSVRDDISDTTPKFVLIGAGNARPARGELGAGTPEREWRLRIALAPSHDEQVQRPIIGTGRTVATGTGRYENLALLYRLPVGSRDSVEVAWNRRTQKSTDLVNLGGENFVFSEQRVLSAERADVALSWRHRWKNLEAALAARYVRPQGSHVTAGSSDLSNGTLLGVGVEGRMRRGPWTLVFGGERMTGSIDVHEESAPHFASRDFGAEAALEAYRLGVSRSWPKTDFFLSATYDRSRLPFVAFAVLGTETVAFDRGFHPESRTRQFLWDLTAQHAIASGVRARVFLRAVYGDETLTLADSAGIVPTRNLSVKREGVFGRGFSRALGSPEITLGVGAVLSLGSTDARALPKSPRELAGGEGRKEESPPIEIRDNRLGRR